MLSIQYYAIDWNTVRAQNVFEGDYHMGYYDD